MCNLNSCVNKLFSILLFTQFLCIFSSLYYHQQFWHLWQMKKKTPPHHYPHHHHQYYNHCYHLIHSGLVLTVQCTIKMTQCQFEVLLIVGVRISKEGYFLQNPRSQPSTCILWHILLETPAPAYMPNNGFLISKFYI